MSCGGGGGGGVKALKEASVDQRRPPAGGGAEETRGPAGRLRMLAAGPLAHVDNPAHSS